MSGKIQKLLDGLLVSDSEIARESGLNEKTVKNLKNGRHAARMATKRAFLDGLNRILEKHDKRSVGPEIFN